MNLDISDDCSTIDQLEISISVSQVQVLVVTFEVNVTDTRCTISTAQAHFDLQVDDEVPTVTCGFFTLQNLCYLLDPNAGLSFPPPDDLLHINYDDLGSKGIANIKLWYQIEVST